MRVARPILLELAKLRAGTGERAEVVRLAEAARETAEACGYALDAADAALALAEAAREAGDLASSRKQARRARVLATGDWGPGLTFALTYERTGALLELLGDDAP